VEPFDHRFLNHEVPPFDRVIPTPENIARDIGGASSAFRASAQPSAFGAAV